MKFAIGLENTKNALAFCNSFFEQIDFCDNFSLDVFIIQEFVEQEKEVEELKVLVEKKLKKEKVTGLVIIDRGDPVGRVAKLIKDQKIDVFVCKYEHSIMGTTFFEELRKEVNIGILTLR